MIKGVKKKCEVKGLTVDTYEPRFHARKKICLPLTTSNTPQRATVT